MAIGTISAAANYLTRSNICHSSLPAGAALTALIAQGQADLAVELNVTSVTGGTIAPSK